MSVSPLIWLSKFSTPADLNYSVAPRSFGADPFPILAPIVSFMGYIVGNGLDMVQDYSVSGLDDVQRKCCGFVRLSTFVNPPDPMRPPFRGFHPFQVFVIIPIYAPPWSIIASKIKDNPRSFFQKNSLFYCQGKVAGLLDHSLLLNSTNISIDDHILIVTPDTWTFHESSNSAPPPTPDSSLKTDPSKKTSWKDRSHFLTPSKKHLPDSDFAGPSTPSKHPRTGMS